MRAFKISLVAFDNVPVPEWLAADFSREGIELAVEECHTQEQLLRVAGDADIVWVRSGSGIVTAESLEALPRARAILRSGTGTDNVPVTEATRRGIVVANTPEAAGDTVAEHAAALLLSFVRQVPQHNQLIREGVWDRNQAWPDWHLAGCTLGLIGFGYIARRFVRKLSGMDMEFLVHDPYLPVELIREHGGTPCEFERLLRDSDFVSVHCPLNERTHHMIGEREFRQMRKRAVVINTSRGPVIDEAALINALREGVIAGAALDVFENEPIAPDNPLLGMRNVVMTPHIAGYSDIFIDNFWRHAHLVLMDIYRGYLPRWLVNPEVQPRFPFKDWNASEIARISGG